MGLFSLKEIFVFGPEPEDGLVQNHWPIVLVLLVEVRVCSAERNFEELLLRSPAVAVTGSVGVVKEE